MDSDNQKIKTCVNVLLDSFGVNLLSVIVSGSQSNLSFEKGWSDFDLLIVLGKVNYSDCIKSSSVITKLGERLGCHVGLDIVSLGDLKDIKFLSTKALQTIFETTRYPSKIVFQVEGVSYPAIADKNIRQMSDELASFFYHDLRKILIRQSTGSSETMTVNFKIIIRRLFNMLKMSVQYVTLSPCQTKEETLVSIRRLFPSLNLDTPNSLLKLVKNWRVDFEMEEIHKYLDDIFTFTQNYFLVYQESKSQLVKGLKK